MSNIPHEILAEFPEFADKISKLKTNDAHFAKLYDEYYEVNKAIHLAETNIEPTDDFNMETMRKNRMVLKDTIYQMLKA